MVLEAAKYKIKVQADSVSGERPLPGVQWAVLLLCTHMMGGAEGEQEGRKRGY